MHDIKKSRTADTRAEDSNSPESAAEEFGKKVDLIIDDKMESLLAVTAPVHEDGLLNLHESVHARFGRVPEYGTRDGKTHESESMRQSVLNTVSVLKNGEFLSLYLKGLGIGSPSAEKDIMSSASAEHMERRNSERYPKYPPQENPSQGVNPQRTKNTLGDVRKACLRVLNKNIGEIRNELEFMNHEFLRKLLLSEKNCHETNPLTELIYADPGLIPFFVSCPIPLSRIAHLKSIYLLTERNKALGYLYILFNNLCCRQKEFTSDTGKIKRLADGMPNDNFIRYFMLRAMAGIGLNITSAADFINRDLPDMYHHYMIRNRRYHLAKYGMKKFVTRNSGRRKEDEAITRQASSAGLNRLSLFTAIYEMLTDRHGSTAPVLNETALITAVILYGQSMKFLKEGLSPERLADDAERAVALIRNTAEKSIMSRSLNEEEIRDALVRASSRIRHRIKGMFIAPPPGDGDVDQNTESAKTSAEDFLRELDTQNAFEVFSAEMKGTDTKSREALGVMRRDSYADAVSSHGFAYKSFTNSPKLPYDTMHRYLSREDRRLIKKELFCQSRDKGRL